MTDGHINADETLWRHRLSKRMASVRFLKASPDYAACSSPPAAPDPFDRKVSKRRWERSMQEFRRALRGQVPRGYTELREESEMGKLPATSSPDPDRMETWATAAGLLCDCWQDHFGVVYNLFFGNAGTFHVVAIYPNGQRCYARGLSRVTIMCRCKNTHGFCTLVRCWANTAPSLGTSEQELFAGH